MVNKIQREEKMKDKYGVIEKLEEFYGIKLDYRCDYALNEDGMIVNLRLCSKRIEDLSIFHELCNTEPFNIIRNTINLTTNHKRFEVKKNYINVDSSNLKYKSPLASLRVLDLWGNQITDISPLLRLVSLEDLSIGFNNLKDVTVLKYLTKLIDLNLIDNQIMDISPLRCLTNLTTLRLWNNQVSDILPLRDLNNLTYVHLEGNPIISIYPLDLL
jgi:internalin A